MTAQVLLTGATGYVGSRLLHRLEASGRKVRCLTRRPEALATRVADATEVVAGDVLNAASLHPAMAGVETAFYLIHSMETSTSFEALDRLAARNFSETARSAGVRRIVYLGGLGSGDRLSPHLASRQEVGAIPAGGADAKAFDQLVSAKSRSSLMSARWTAPWSPRGRIGNACSEAGERTTVSLRSPSTSAPATCP